MSIWILTIGSSDVQLDSDSVSQQKERTAEKYSDKVWRYWYDDLQYEHKLPSSEAPTRSGKDKSDTYRILPRVLGRVYNLSPESIQQEILSYLTFPLLDSFTQAMKDYPHLHTIVVLLTDQSNIMANDKDKDSPYWKDTCELEPILRHYFREKFPNTDVEVVILSPISAEKGLDNWDAVFDLVSQHFKTLSLPQAQSDTVFVSHQAGTPALSAAVQFCSLAKFTDRVRFLVSNEYNPENTGFVESSSYLKGIKKEQAKKLLENYDYAGVNQLVHNYLTENDRVLMRAALEWNVAQFHSFLTLLENNPQFTAEVQTRKRPENWWWIAYEEVYLAVIRHRQGNMVEAFFHSFRAFEGIFASWSRSHFDRYTEVIKGIPYLSPSILDDPDNPLSKVTGKDAKKAIKDIISNLEKLKDKLQKQEEKIEKHEWVELNLATICKLFKAIRYADYKQNCPELKIFWDDEDDQNVCKKRNFIFHQVRGMEEVDFLHFWGVSSPQELEQRLLKFLNFIVKEDLPQGFETLQQASLLPKVHAELQKTIDLL